MACRIYPYEQKYGAVDIGCDSIQEALQLRNELREYFRDTGSDFTTSIIPHTQIVEIQHRISMEDAHRFLSEFMRRR